MYIFHSIFLFIQLSYLFFYFRFQHVLMDDFNIVPLTLAILMNIYLFVFVVIRNLDELFPKTIHISVYIVFIGLSSYLYLNFITSSIGLMDNTPYIFFIMNLIFFLYYLFDKEEESIISVFTIILALVYLDNTTSRALSYFWINGDVGFFQAYFNNINTNFYIYNLIKDELVSNIVFYFIFIYQFIFIIGLFIIKHPKIKLTMLSIGILIHIFLMVLYQNVFFHLIIIFMYLPLLVPIFEGEKLFDKEKLSLKAFLIVSALFIFASVSNLNHIENAFDKPLFKKETTLFDIEKTSSTDKKGISFSDSIIPLEKFSYNQIESLKKYDKGIFSQRYLKVYLDGKKIYSTINPYFNGVNISPYNTLLLSIFNHYYALNDKKANRIFKYLFKGIKKPIVVEQGYLFLEDINKKKLSVKVIKVTEDISQNIILDKDFFKYTIRNNNTNSKFIYVN